MLLVIGILIAVAGVVYLVYRHLNPTDQAKMNTDAQALATDVEKAAESTATDVTTAVENVAKKV